MYYDSMVTRFEGKIYCSEIILSFGTLNKLVSVIGC